MLHLALHFIIPFFIAWFFFRDVWLKAWLIMIATMIIDIDHLIADPIYDPNRCSINFHPLHTYPFIAGYVVMSFWRKTRLVGIGLVIHIALDFIDCLVQGNVPWPFR
jgi:hypothetical protein